MVYRAILIAALLLTWAPAHAGVRGAKRQAKTRVFKTRAALEKAFGKKTCDQVPETFDFSLFALVWVALPAAADATVKITTLPADSGFQMNHSDGLALWATRRTKTLEFQLQPDDPCAGGMDKPPDIMKSCTEAVSSSAAMAEKTLHLFATPRAKLESAKATVMPISPRP